MLSTEPKLAYPCRQENEAMLAGLVRAFLLLVLWKGNPDYFLVVFKQILDLREGFMPEECKGEEEPSTQFRERALIFEPVLTFRLVFIFRLKVSIEYVFDDRMNDQNQTILQRAAQNLFSLQLNHFLSSADKGKQDPPWPQPEIGFFAFGTIKIEGLSLALTRINVSIAGRGGVQGFES
ncbi:hypothetical protein M9H77_23621 [Catharanthus roseus]|uniref:Uncharacterized protein n=1 Tax=Catharanthus roseus TaxID=4058 RepID=A0ACC0AXY5_CATRO|nr:hypothetical protein M9H77_23621 [Catharanthus roseus]